jgi:hypothetical protein
MKTDPAAPTATIQRTGSLMVLRGIFFLGQYVQAVKAIAWFCIADRLRTDAWSAGYGADSISMSLKNLKPVTSASPVKQTRLAEEPKARVGPRGSSRTRFIKDLPSPGRRPGGRLRTGGPPHIAGSQLFPIRVGR